MAKFRCNTCKHLSFDFCNKLKEGLPNDLVKLFYGGAVGLYSGTVTYPSTCGIEKELKHEAEVEGDILVPETVCPDQPKTHATACNSSE